MLIENKWHASYDNEFDIQENNSLISLSRQWNSQIIVKIIKHSKVVKDPIKYTKITKK